MRRNIVLRIVFVLAGSVLGSLGLAAQTGEEIAHVSRFGVPFSVSSGSEAFTAAAHPTFRHSTADSQSVLTKLGQWGWGPCDAVAVKGKYAFIGNGALLQVLDISDPHNPRPVGELLTHGPVRNVVIVGDYAYTLAPFRVIDISVPTHPCLVSTLSSSAFRSPPLTLSADGHHAYVGDLFGALYIIDISNPSYPHVVNPWMSIVLSGQLTTAIAVRGNYLYASTYDGRTLDIFDISDPGHPTSAAHLFDMRGSAPLTFDGDYLYTGSGSQLQVYQSSDPLRPRYVTGLNLPAKPTAISVINSVAYVSLDSAGFAAVNVADTANIQLLGKIRYPYPHGLAYQPYFGPIAQSLSPTAAYLATGTGLWVVDIGGLPVLTSVSFFPTAWGAWRIVTDSSSHAFLAELYGGLKILDFSNPFSPQLIGQYYSGESVRDVAVANNRAYLLCDSDLVVLDVSNPQTPVLMNKLAFGDTLNENNGVGAFGSISVYGSTAYVARSSNKLITINIANPNKSEVIATYRTRGCPVDISRFDHYLYLANADNGIQIFDISVPAVLKEDGFLGITPLREINVANNKLFTTDVANFSVYEIIDPLKPQLKYSLRVPGGSTTAKIKSQKSFAYVSNHYSLVLIDISNPDSGKIVYSGNANDYGIYGFWGVEVSNGILMVGVGDQGVFVMNNILDNPIQVPSAATGFALSQNFPNPFNYSTMITYQLDVSSYVTLQVHDVLGREVYASERNFQEAGKHCTGFRAGRLASGVYIYRVSANGSSQTKKMVILK